MFERLKNALTHYAKPAFGVKPPDAMSVWASERGLSLIGGAGAETLTLSGHISGMPWKIERGRSSRNYISGDELRARAELKLNDGASVLIMNRHLKQVLEKRTYEAYTDTLQTTADLDMPEEMRWLSMYPEVGWDSLPLEFWKRYAVLAEKREHASAWLDPQLAHLLMQWPDPVSGAEVPFVLMILRGKAYLRMQYNPANTATLQHAAQIFTHACLSGLSTLASAKADLRVKQ